jgi:hypothetical protein
VRAIVHAVDEIIEECVLASSEPFEEAPADRRVNLAIVMDFSAGDIAVGVRVAIVPESPNPHRIVGGVLTLTSSSFISSAQISLRPVAQ